MKNHEIFSDLKVLAPVVVRIDGRDFKHELKRLSLEKPYDERFARAMADSSELFLKKSGIEPLFLYTFSDEVNIFFLGNLPFNGRLEKLDSVIPSFFSSALTVFLDLKSAISFDSRVIPICQDNLNEYMAWRQAEAWRNHINSYAYYTLIESSGKREAIKKLKGMNSAQIHDMLFLRGINLNNTPKWQRRGILVAKESYEKEGYNPKLDKKEITFRARVTQNWEVPIFRSEDGKKFIEGLIGGA